MGKLRDIRNQRHLSRPNILIKKKPAFHVALTRGKNELHLEECGFFNLFLRIKEGTLSNYTFIGSKGGTLR
jgi:hypothetical protein